MELSEIVRFDVSEAACSQLASLYMDLRITSVEDLSGFRAVHSARMVVKGKRVEVEKRRKELKEEALAWGKTVDGEAKRIFGLLEPIEDHLDKEETEYLKKKEQKKKDVEAEENRQLQEKFDALAGHGVILPWAEIRAMTSELFAARMNEAMSAFQAEKERKEEERREEESRQAEAARVASEQAAEQSRIEARRLVEMEAERKKLEEIAREQDRVAADLQKERARLEEIAREHARLEAARGAAEQALKDADHLAHVKQEKEFLEKILDPLAEEERIREVASQEKMSQIRRERGNPFDLFNASGHPIDQDDVTVIGEVSVPNVDLADPAAVYSLALDIAKAARNSCENGIPITLPGMTVLAAHVLSMLQGLTGQLPIIAWAARIEGKFVWSRTQMIDLHAMRVLIREGRLGT